MKQEHKDGYLYKEERVELPTTGHDNFVEVHCPKCSSTVPAENIELKNHLAKCSSCNVMFSIDNRVEELKAKIATSDEIIDRPKGIEKLVLENELELSMTQSPAWIYIFPAIISPLFILISSLIFFKDGHIGGLYGLVASIAIFIYTVYKSVARRRDKVYITVDEHDIHFEHIPKNLITDKSLSRNSIEQFYLKVSGTGLSLFAITNGPEGQNHQKVLSNFSNVFHASYIEQELESYLNIKNKKVTGVYK